MDNSLATWASKLFDLEALDSAPADLLNEIAHSARSLGALWHPLGFVNIELGALNQSIYRLHIWPQHERHAKTPDWRIHTHVYDLESFVVAGSITDRKYAVQILGNTGSWLFGVRYNEAGSVLEPLGVEVAAKVEKESTHSAFARYQIARDVFHSSEVRQDQLAITVVKLTNRSGSQPLVVGDRHAPTSSFAYKQEAVSSDLLDPLLIAISDSLSACPE